MKTVKSDETLDRLFMLFLEFILKVHFEKIPKVEKGFDFSHEDFDLDAKSQALLEIRYS